MRNDMVDPWLPGMYRAHAARLRAALGATQKQLDKDDVTCYIGLGS